MLSLTFNWTNYQLFSFYIDLFSWLYKKLFSVFSIYGNYFPATCKNQEQKGEITVHYDNPISKWTEREIITKHK